MRAPALGAQVLTMVPPEIPKFVNTSKFLGNLLRQLIMV